MRLNVNMDWRRRRKRRRILVVNGMELVYEGIANCINACRDLSVCGKAFDEQTALERVSSLRPSLVVTEIFQPQDLGFVRKLRRCHPRVPILAFSFRDEQAYAPRALQAGARGYLMKNVDGQTFVAGIRKILRGGVSLSPTMAARLRRKGGYESSRLRKRSITAESPVCSRMLFGVRRGLPTRSSR